MISVTAKITYQTWKDSITFSKFFDQGLFFNCFCSIFPDIFEAVSEVTSKFTERKHFDSKPSSLIWNMLLKILSALLEDQLFINSNTFIRSIHVFKLYSKLTYDWTCLEKVISSVVFWIVITVVTEVEELIDKLETIVRHHVIETGCL